MPILLIFFILLGITIYLRFLNIRKYRVAPSIKSDNDFNCKVEHGEEWH